MSAATYFRGLFTISRERPAYAQAARGAIVWFGFIAIGIAADEVLFGFQAGFVGWIVCFTDDSRAVGRRFGGAGLLTLVSAAATFVASVAGNYIVWSVVVSALIGTGCVLWGVVGPAGVKKGLVTMFLTLFAIGFPTSVGDAVGLAVASVVGGLGAGLLILISLPFGSSRNQSDVAAENFEGAASLAGAYARGSSAEEVSRERTALAAGLRDVYSETRFSVIAGGRGAVVEQVDQATSVMRAIAAFADVRSVSHLVDTPEIRRVYSEVAQLCSETAERIRRPGADAPDVSGVTAAIDVVLDQVGEQAGDVSAGAGALRDLRATVVAIERADGASANLSDPNLTRFGPSFSELVRANLRYDTILRRHLFRYLTLIVAATLLYKIADIPDGFFITLGINIMLQPDLGAGFARVQVFSLGTVAGSVIGAVIGVYAGSDPIVIGLWTAAAIFCVIAYIKLTYWAFAVGISVFIVAALGLITPAGWDLAIWRIVNTLIAAAFVAVGLAVLWPSTGKRLVPPEISRILRDEASFLAATVSRSGRADLETHRRRVVAEHGELGLRIEQYSKEPGHSLDTLDNFRSTLMEIRRIQGSISDLATTLDSGAVTPDADTRAIADRVEDTFCCVADAFERNEPVEALPKLVDKDAARPLSAIDAELSSIGVCAQALGGRLPVRK